jgi:hypothetical protein
MTWVRVLGYAAFSALGRVYQVVILDKILSKKNHVTRFKAMYSELQCTPGWTDLDIFTITYDEYMAFSRQYMAGQITLNLAVTSA